MPLPCQLSGSSATRCAASKESEAVGATLYGCRRRDAALLHFESEKRIVSCIWTRWGRWTFQDIAERFMCKPKDWCLHCRC